MARSPILDRANELCAAAREKAELVELCRRLDAACERLKIHPLKLIKLYQNYCDELLAAQAREKPQPPAPQHCCIEGARRGVVLPEMCTRCDWDRFEARNRELPPEEQCD